MKKLKRGKGKPVTTAFMFPSNGSAGSIGLLSGQPGSSLKTPSPPSSQAPLPTSAGSLGDAPGRRGRNLKPSSDPDWDLIPPQIKKMYEMVLKDSTDEDRTSDSEESVKLQTKSNGKGGAESDQDVELRNAEMSESGSEAGDKVAAGMRGLPVLQKKGKVSQKEREQIAVASDHIRRRVAGAAVLGVDLLREQLGQYTDRAVWSSTRGYEKLCYCFLKGCAAVTSAAVAKTRADPDEHQQVNVLHAVVMCNLGIYYEFHGKNHAAMVALRTALRFTHAGKVQKSIPTIAAEIHGDRFGLLREFRYIDTFAVYLRLARICALVGRHGEAVEKVQAALTHLFGRGGASPIDSLVAHRLLTTEYCRSGLDAKAVQTYVTALMGQQNLGDNPVVNAAIQGDTFAPLGLQLVQDVIEPPPRPVMVESATQFPDVDPFERSRQLQRRRENLAALTIQRYATRSFLPRLRQDEAARRIQKGTRQYFWTKKRKLAVNKMQAAWRAHMDRQWYKRTRDAAANIQDWYKVLFHAKRKNAAIRIQCAWRGYYVRLRYRNIKRTANRFFVGGVVTWPSYKVQQRARSPMKVLKNVIEEDSFIQDDDDDSADTSEAGAVAGESMSAFFATTEVHGDMPWYEILRPHLDSSVLEAGRDDGEIYAADIVQDIVEEAMIASECAQMERELVERRRKAEEDRKRREMEAAKRLEDELRLREEEELRLKEEEELRLNEEDRQNRTEDELGDAEGSTADDGGSDHNECNSADSSSAPLKKAKSEKIFNCEECRKYSESYQPRDGLTHKEHARLRIVFKKFDHDGDFRLQFEEFSSLCESLGFSIDNIDKVKSFFEERDLDSDGTICYHEFADWYALEKKNIDVYAREEEERLRRIEEERLKEEEERLKEEEERLRKEEEERLRKEEEEGLRKEEEERLKKEEEERLRKEEEERLRKEEEEGLRKVEEERLRKEEEERLRKKEEEERLKEEEEERLRKEEDERLKKEEEERLKEEEEERLRKEEEERLRKEEEERLKKEEEEERLRKEEEERLKKEEEERLKKEEEEERLRKEEEERLKKEEEEERLRKEEEERLKKEEEERLRKDTDGADPTQEQSMSPKPVYVGDAVKDPKGNAKNLKRQGTYSFSVRRALKKELKEKTTVAQGDE